VTWAEVEEAVAAAVFAAMNCDAACCCDEDDFRQIARAAIRTMQELRLTAVVPDG
jgi:hypothetical protein